MLRLEAYVILIFLSSITAKAQDSIPAAPTNITVSWVTYDGFDVNYFSNSNDNFHEIKVSAKFNSKDTRLINSSDTSKTVTGLGSNIIYRVSVRSISIKGIKSNFSEEIEARTYPNGSSVVTTNSLPTIVTVFLDPQPGATEWIVELVDSTTGAASYSNVTSPYKIFRGLTPDTEYAVRAKISRINDNPINLSQYGEKVLVTTAKLSMFGRVVLIGEKYVSNLTTFMSQKWADALYKEYSKTQSNISGVRVLSHENSVSPAGVLLQHEILTKGTKIPELSTLQLNDASIYSGLIVTNEVNANHEYGINTDPDNHNLFVFVVSDENCDEKKMWDKKYFILHRHDGWIKAVDLNSQFLEDTEIILENDFSFEKTELVNPANGKVYQYLASNSLYSVDQNYLFKTCQAERNAVSLCGRRYKASYYDTVVKYRNTFIHSTGGVEVDTSKTTYSVSDDLRGITIRMPAIYRAFEYNFYINGGDNVTLSNLDSSSHIEATLGGYEMIREYCIYISVTINHPDWRRETSAPSCFLFFSGSPNSTTIRISGVREESFQVLFKEVNFTTKYIIEVSNETYSLNYTTTEIQPFSVTNDVLPGLIYNVRVATQNPFGIGMFSDMMSTKFWSFHSITNNSVGIKWETYEEDERYEIRVLETQKMYTKNTGQIIVEKLNPGIVYHVNVTAVLETGEHIFLFEDKQITVPGMPVNVTITKNTSNSLQIFWDFVIGADFYNVIIKGREMKIIRNTSSTFSVFSELLYGVKYKFEVTAQNEAGVGEVTQADYVTDFLTPTNVSVWSVTNSTFTVGWSSIRGANQYQILLQNGNGSYKNFSSPTHIKEISGLKAGTNYSINIYAFYDEGLSSPSNLIYQITEPEAPSNLRQINNTNSTIIISWDVVNGIVYYEVRTECVCSTQPIHSVLQATEASAKLRNLIPNTGYNVAVKSVNKAGTSYATSRMFFTEFLVPSKVVITEVKSNSFVVSWRGSDDAKKFLVIVNLRKNAKRIVINGFKTLIDDLQPSTNYSITVTAEYSAGQSDSSEAIYQLTTPAPPRNLHLLETYTDFIKVSWNISIGADRYTVYTEGRGTSSTTNTTITLSNLSPGTECEIRVQAHNSAGSSNYTTAIFETLPRSPAFSVTNVTDTSLAIVWNATNGSIKYNVTITADNGNSISGITGVGISIGTSVEVKGLDIDTGYFIEVQALSKVGISPKKHSIYIGPAPPRPRNVTLVERTSTFVKITWDKVTNATKYEFTCNGVTAASLSNFAIIDELLPGINYSFTLKSVGYSGRRSSSTTEWIQTLPASPSLRIFHITQTSFNISWNAQSGAEYYKIKVFNGETKQQHADISTNRTRTMVFGLTPGTTYIINGSSTHDEEVSSPQSTTSETTLCLPPSGVEVSSVTHNSITIRWNETHGALRYDIEIGNRNQIISKRSTESSPKIEINSTTGIISGLSSGTEYALKLFAINSAGRSESSDVTIKTGASNPESLGVKNVSTSTVTLEWTIQRGAVSYKLYIKDVLLSRKWSMTLNQTTNVIVGPLSSGKKYEFLLTTLTEIVPSKIFENEENSPRISIITVPAPPENLTVSRIGDNLAVNWTKSVGTVLYFVYVESSMFQATYNTTQTELKCSFDVIQNIEYLFTIAAQNSEDRLSLPSLPFIYKETHQMRAKSTAVPWWVIIIVCSVILVIIIGLAIWCLTKRQKNIGFYNSRDDVAEGEVAADEIQMKDFEQPKGEIGPQGSDTEIAENENKNEDDSHE